MIQTIYVRITQPDLPPAFRVWFASHAYNTSQSPAQRVEILNRLAAAQSLNTTYQLATRHEYLSYRAAVTRELTSPATPAPADPRAASRDRHDRCLG